MFNVEIISALGNEPLIIPASQVVIRMPNGTPVSLAALYGGPDILMVSHCDDPNFNENLRKLGIDATVITTRLKV